MYEQPAPRDILVKSLNARAFPQQKTLTGGGSITRMSAAQPSYRQDGVRTGTSCGAVGHVSSRKHNELLPLDVYTSVHPDISVHSVIEGAVLR